MERSACGGNGIKLRGADNWTVWKFQVEILIRAKGNHALLNREPTEKEQDEDAKTQALIVNKIEEQVLSNLTTCKTAYQLWQKLKTIFEQESTVNKHLLHTQFYNLKYEGNLTRFLSQIEEIVAKLNAQDEKLSESMIMTKVLMSLPPEYRHIVSAWESVPENKQTFNELSARLYIEESRLSSHDTPDNALVSRTHSRYQVNCFKCSKTGHIARNCPSNQHLVCHFCHKKGHKQDKCFHRLLKEKNKEEKNPDRSALITSVIDEAFISSSTSEDWILDSGATQHMCHNRELFSIFNDNCTRKVTIGDGTLLNVLGTGTVSVLAWNGQKWLETTLNDVLYVPGLKVNLFSVPKCMDKGLVMKCDSSSVKISNTQGEVRAIAKRSGVSAAEVTLNGAWKENFGWEVTCSWQTWLNDTLQSVRLFRNEKQFVIYRPETSGHQFSEVVPSEEFLMTINCRLASARGQRGSCVTKIELHRNATEDTYKCEVSGERPHFRLEAKEYNAFVPPTYTSVKKIETDATKKVLNCTSSGLPAPKLIWTVNGQKIPEDFTYTAWNKTSKLWHSWSSFNPQTEMMKVTCTPVVTTKYGVVERGWPVEYDLARNAAALNNAAKMIVIISLMTSLWR